MDLDPCRDALRDRESVQALGAPEVPGVEFAEQVPL